MTADPFLLGRHELDATPHWVQDNTRGTGQGLGRCNIFGYEDDRIVVLGGTRDPRHEEYVWYCRNWADARYRATCPYGHSGIMRICYAHAYAFRRRMANFCPRCAMPPRAREIEQATNEIMREMAGAGLDRRRQLYGRLEDYRAEMNEMIERGEVRAGAPLRLEEVS